MKPLFIPLAFLIAFLSATLTLPAEEWKGWRGFEKQGISEARNLPLEWSDSTHILWKTPITGTGHSSPVTDQNHIYITSVYENEEEINRRPYLLYLLFILSIVLVFIILYLSLRSGDPIFTWKGIINLVAPAFTLGVWLLGLNQVALFDPERLDNHISSMLMWLFSWLLVLILLVLSSRLSSSKKQFLLLAVLSLVLTPVFLFLRPSPEYYQLTGNGNFVTPFWFVTTLYLLFSASNLFSYFRRVKSPEVITPVSNSFLKPALSLLIITGTWAIIFVYRGVRYDLPQGEDTLWMDLMQRDYRIFIALIVISFGLHLLGTLFHKSTSSRQGYRWAYYIPLLLALALFPQIQINNKSQSKYKQAIICLNKEDGKEKWTYEAPFTERVHLHPDNTYATPTPIIDNDHVYAYFGSSGLYCVDKVGKLVWKRTDIPYYSIHGIGASPILFKDRIYIINDQATGPYLMCIDKTNGKTLWLSRREGWEGSHGVHRTPTPIHFKGQDALIIWGFLDVKVYHADTGEEMYSMPVKHRAGEVVSTIINVNDTLLMPNTHTTFCMDLKAMERGDDPILWSLKMRSKGPNCSSPLVYKQLAFMVSDHGFATCVHMGTGELLWKHRLSTDTYYSSPILSDGILYFFSTNGHCTLIKAKDSLEIVAENQLSEGVSASPVTCGNTLIVRTHQSVLCIH